METNNQQHYICTGGCGGVSIESDICHDPNCPHVGQDMTACQCGDMEGHIVE